MERPQILILYRQILKAAKLFPSVKRNAIIQDIKLEFRAHKSLADPQKIRKELELAVRSLDQLQSYANLNRTASEWELSLRGPL